MENRRAWRIRDRCAADCGRRRADRSAPDPGASRYRRILSGARVGTWCGSGWPSDGPPKPPSPRAKREATSVASSSPLSSLSTVLCRITAPLSLPLSHAPRTVESAVMLAATGSGLWKVMSRSPSTTIRRLRFISPGLAPHAATEAKVGTTFNGRAGEDGLVDVSQFLLVHRVGAHADAIGVQHHLAIGVGVFLAEVFQRHQLVVFGHCVLPPEFFSCPGRDAAFFTLSAEPGPSPSTGVRCGHRLSQTHRSSRELRAALRPGQRIVTPA